MEAGDRTRPTGSHEWRFGTDADVAWIQGATVIGRTIDSAIPPVFESYATSGVADKDQGRAEQVDLLVRLLRQQSGDQPWWLGYLDTGADDIVLPAATPWRCLGGPDDLIQQVLREPALEPRWVRLGEDATPPGHVAY